MITTFYDSPLGEEPIEANPGGTHENNCLEQAYFKTCHYLTTDIDRTQQFYILPRFIRIQRIHQGDL